jgi:hypothetical protein
VNVLCSCQKVSSSALPRETHHDALPHHGPEIMKPSNHGLKLHEKPFLLTLS